MLPTESIAIATAETKKSYHWWFYFVGIASGLALLPLGCVSMEFAYRAVKWHSLKPVARTWVQDSTLIYKLNPQNAQFPQSFRGKAPSPYRRNEVRIICVGGSTTFGHEVSAEQAWPAATERVLKTQGIDAEVINAGVQGYGSRQLLLRYRRDIASIQPDYVVIYEGWNRTGPLVDPAGWVPFGFDIVRPGQERKPELVTYLALHSFLMQRFITRAALKRGERQKTSAGWFESSLPYSVDSYQDVFISDFTQLVKEIRAHRQQPVLVLYPALYFPEMTKGERSIFEPMLWAHRPLKPEMLEELESKHSAIRAIAQSTETPLVDIKAAFSSIRGQDRAALFMDEMHLTPLGNQKVGEVLGDFLANDIFNRKTSKIQVAAHAPRATTSGARLQ
jgi:lysophospholipase L1-like esterase